MTSINDFLATDHHRCDNLFAVAEAAAAHGDWDNATTGFSDFQEALQLHFAMEETILFPAFEARTGMMQGPTAIMRSEHRQMSDLLNQMMDALADRNGNAYLGAADTLLIIMQQHNMKEELVLYQMADRLLTGELDEMVGLMRAMS